MPAPRIASRNRSSLTRSASSAPPRSTTGGPWRLGSVGDIVCRTNSEAEPYTRSLMLAIGDFLYFTSTKRLNRTLVPGHALSVGAWYPLRPPFDLRAAEPVGRV